MWRRVWKWPFRALGPIIPLLQVLKAILGIPSDLDDAATWHRWLPNFGSRDVLVNPETPVTLFAIAVSLFAWDVPQRVYKRFARFQQPRLVPEVSFTSSSGPANTLRLSVTNRGPKETFWAQCRILATRNNPNKRSGSYTLRWVESATDKHVLATSRTGNLLIANFKTSTHREPHCEMTLPEYHMDHYCPAISPAMSVG